MVLAEADKDAVVAVFTSGGVISTLVSQILGLPESEALRLNWRIYNASITELRYGRSGFALDIFNSVAHLRLGQPPDLVTYW